MQSTATMSWFDTAGLANLAKNALKEAQKQIDKALDIKDQDDGISEGGGPTEKRVKMAKTEPSTPSSGLAGHLTSKEGLPTSWGSFTGSFFDAVTAPNVEAVTTPPSISSPKEQPTTSDGFRYNDCSSESVDLITSPSTPSITSPLQSTPTILGSESIEVLGHVSQAASENSSILVVASTVTTPGSEFSENRSLKSPSGDTDEPVAGEDYEEEEEEEEEDNTMSESLAVTIMEPNQNEIITVPPSRQSLHLSLTSTSLSRSETSQCDTEGSNESENAVTNSGSRPDKGQKTKIMSLENFEMQTEFSDSTQSFEEINHESPKSGSDVVKISTTNISIGDDETTTSSDIEIISNPNGDSSSTQSRVSPNKEANQTLHKSKLGSINRGHSRELSTASSQCSDELSETDRLQKRVSELSEQLEKREYKLVELVKLNNELQLRNEQMSLQLSDSTAQNQNRSSIAYTSSSAAGSVDVEEYTQRLSALEKKFQQSIREREQLRDQLKTARIDLEKRIKQDVFEKEVKDKDFVINELKQEGEKLSKEVLHHSNIIKKLRVKEKESDELNRRNRDQIKEQLDELERMKRNLSAKEEMERSQIEAINRLASEKKKLEAENVDLKSKLDDSIQKLEALQVSFSATKLELVDQKKCNIELKQKSSSLESQFANQSEQMLKNQQAEMDLLELREKLKQTEMGSVSREQALRREKTELMRRLEESEYRNEELNQQLATATVPVLKQLENLQSTLIAKESKWEHNEKAYFDQLSEANSKMEKLLILEKNTEEKNSKSRVEIELLESRVSSLVLKVEELNATLQQKEFEYNFKVGDLDREICKYKKEISRIEEQKTHLERKFGEVTSDRDKLETELRMKKSFEISQQFEKEELGVETEVPENDHRLSPALSLGNSLDESIHSSVWPIDDIDTSSNHGRPSLGSFYGQLGFGIGHTTALENLQSNLKQRDGEVYHLQWELNRLQSQRTILTNEVSELTSQIEVLTIKSKEYDQMMDQLKELQKKYDAMLQLYGEKVEETEELKLDLQDVKEMYKAQIDDQLKG